MDWQLKKELSDIGKALDDKATLPWWIVDEYVGLLRQCHEKLLKMKPKKSCQNCKHFTLAKCALVDAVPPDEIKAKGCEKFYDNLKDFLG